MRKFSIQYKGNKYTRESNNGSHNIPGAVPPHKNSLKKHNKVIRGINNNK